MTSEFSVAVHALTFLNHKSNVQSSEALAENVCTNAARVRKVMAKLKKSGLVVTKEGVDGGYMFAKNPEEIDLCSIAEALDTAFVSAKWQSGNPEENCLIASGMAGVLTDIYADLDALCKKRLKELTIADVDKMIFKDGMINK